MANNKQIKRVVLKSGVVRYYQNGKQITQASGRRKFLKQNPKIDRKTIIDSPLKSKKKKEKPWLFKNLAHVPFAYVDILTKLAIINPKKIKNRDLYNVFENGVRKFNNFKDIKRIIDEEAKNNALVFQWCNEKGLPGYRGRDFETFANNKIQNIVDIVNLIDSQAYRRFKFYVIDRQGDLQSGRVLGLLALRDFEIDVGSEIQKLVPNSAYLRFCYDYTIKYEQKEIEINLTDMYADENETDGYKSLKWYVDNAQGTGSKEQLIISDKYKDVEITIEFS
jgi:hypothetical protein